MTDGSNPEQAFRPQVLENRYVFLRPVSPEDYLNLRHIEIGSVFAARWRFRGATPSPEQWQAGFWANTLVQFLVVSKRDDKVIGLVTAYDPDFADGHAKLAVLSFDDQHASLPFQTAIALFIDYLLRGWALRKLYMEVVEFNYPQFAAGVDRWFTVEGRLCDHTFYDGRYWDQLVLATSRGLWDNQRGRLQRFLDPR